MGLDAAIAAARLLEAAGAAVLFGAPLLLRVAASPPAAAPWSRPMLAVTAAAVALGSVLALGLQTVGMAGSVREGLAPGALGDVLRDTGFGRSVLVRVVAAVAALALLARRRTPRLGVTLAGAAALASLAWSGHGAADEGPRGAVHLAGDLAHLLAAGAWLGALAGLLALALGAQGRPERAEALARALTAFSGLGVGVVAILVLSGLVNAWFLVGPQHWRGLASDPWGRVLLLKLFLFALMVALAALNRWRLTPALAAQNPRAAGVAALRASVAIETLLGVGVLLAAAVMGGLPPPAAQG